MSEQQIAEALGADIEEQLLADEQVEEQEDDLSDLSPAEQKAWADGWRPEDQFEGNKANWKTAGEYNLYGEMQVQIRDAKSEARRVAADADARIANLNRLHQAQQESTIAELRRQQRDAVSDMDTEKYDQLQDKIDKTQAAVVQQPQQQGKLPQIEEWERNNAWSADANDDRTRQANSFYAIAIQKPGATIESCLEYVDNNLAKLYPELSKAKSNPRREIQTMTEQSSTPRPRNRGGKELSMSDLTQSERSDWEKFGKMMFNDEKQYLKSVSDARKA